MRDCEGERNALGFNCRDTVSAAALKLFGKNTRGTRDQIRIIKDIGSVKEVAAEQTGRIDQPPRKFRLQRFDLFLRNVRNETDAAFGTGNRFQITGSGHPDRLTGGLDIFADAGFCSTEEITKILKTVNSVRQFCQNLNQRADSFRTFHAFLPPLFVP